MKTAHPTLSRPLFTLSIFLCLSLLIILSKPTLAGPLEGKDQTTPRKRMILLYGQGMKLWQEGSPGKGAKKLEEALNVANQGKITPGIIAVSFQLGRLYLEQGRTKKAIENLEQASLLAGRQKPVPIFISIQSTLGDARKKDWQRKRRRNLLTWRP